MREGHCVIQWPRLQPKVEQAPLLTEHLAQTEQHLKAYQRLQTPWATGPTEELITWSQGTNNNSPMKVTVFAGAGISAPRPIVAQDLMCFVKPDGAVVAQKTLDGAKGANLVAAIVRPNGTTTIEVRYSRFPQKTSVVGLPQDARALASLALSACAKQFKDSAALYDRAKLQTFAVNPPGLVQDRDISAAFLAGDTFDDGRRFEIAAKFVTDEQRRHDPMGVTIETYSAGLGQSIGGILHLDSRYPGDPGTCPVPAAEPAPAPATAAPPAPAASHRRPKALPQGLRAA